MGTSWGVYVCTKEALCCTWLQRNAAEFTLENDLQRDREDKHIVLGGLDAQITGRGIIEY